MQEFSSILDGVLGGGLVAWLLRNWIQERMRRSIEHEFATKLESHKAELNGQLAQISREFESHKLRTSLAFEHKRAALVAVLSEIVTLRDRWYTQSVDREFNNVGPVPFEALTALKQVFYAQQLFLDRRSISAIELIIDIATDSLPFNDGESVHARDGEGPFDDLEYLLPLVAELFRDRLDIERSGSADLIFALFGAIRLVNRYHFVQIKLPAKGPLSMGDSRASDAIAVAAANAPELVAKLWELKEYLNNEKMGVFHEALAKITRYLEVLDPRDQQLLPRIDQSLVVSP